MISTCILSILDFKYDEFPSQYVGLPFFSGPNKPKFWYKILTQIQNRIVSWKGKWLTMAGKLTLTKVVLSAIPNYIIPILNLQKSSAAKFKTIYQKVTLAWEPWQQEKE